MQAPVARGDSPSAKQARSVGPALDPTQSCRYMGATGRLPPPPWYVSDGLLASNATTHADHELLGSDAHQWTQWHRPRGGVGSAILAVSRLPTLSTGVDHLL